MMVDKRRPDYAVCSEALYYDEWYPCLTFYDRNGERNEAEGIITRLDASKSFVVCTREA